MIPLSKKKKITLCSCYYLCVKFCSVFQRNFFKLDGKSEYFFHENIASLLLGHQNDG